MGDISASVMPFPAHLLDKEEVPPEALLKSMAPESLLQSQRDHAVTLGPAALDFFGAFARRRETVNPLEPYELEWCQALRLEKELSDLFEGARIFWKHYDAGYPQPPGMGCSAVANVLAQQEWEDNKEQRRMQNEQDARDVEHFIAMGLISTGTGLHDLIGKIVLCSDDQVRRLLEVHAKECVYEVPIGDETRSAWQRLSPTWRSRVEESFLQGRVFARVEDALAAPSAACAN
jgi:hypothetical protein